jgi:hypothetical protein
MVRLVVLDCWFRMFGARSNRCRKRRAADCVQSPAMLMIATPVILPSASKPNRRLVASPRVGLDRPLSELGEIYTPNIFELVFAAESTRKPALQVGVPTARGQKTTPESGCLSGRRRNSSLRKRSKRNAIMILMGSTSLSGRPPILAF